MTTQPNGTGRPDNTLQPGALQPYVPRPAESGDADGTPLLEVRDLAVTYRSGADDVRAVRGVNFTLRAGQTLGVAGESGCGKTTVALSLLRLLPVSARLSGQILFRGEDVIGLGWQKLRAVRWAQASVVFQGAMSALNPVQTIGDQIREPILLHEQVTRREADLRTAELLDSVGVAARRQASYPHELSGGQRQRVMIAMALACRPDLIIADEPTTALDVIVQAQILSLLTGLVADRGISMLVISHDLSVLGETCDRLAIMYGGRLVELGPSRQVLAEPEHPYTAILSRAFPRLGDPTSRLAPAGLAGEPPDLRGEMPGCPFAPRCPEVMPECRTHDIELWPAGPQRESACIKVLGDDAGQRPAETRAGESGAAQGVGTPLGLSRPRAEMSAAEGAEASSGLVPPQGGSSAEPPVLEARALRVVFPGRRGRRPARAVDNVNLAIGRGEIVALIGESGCGKSTLARALVGLVEPADGEVRYEGAALGYSGPALRSHRRHVQLVLQDPAAALNPRQTVFDAVAEGPRVHGLRAGLNERVYTALTRAGLRPPEQFMSRYPHELSGGQQQRVVIAGALALDPSVLVADEPVSSLDASVRGEILKLILSLRNEYSVASLIVSHDLGVAWNIADSVAVMYLGRIVEAGPVAEVLLRPRHPYTQALLSVLPDAHTGEPAPVLAGEPPDPTAIPSGCRFHPRCPRLAALPPGDARAELCRSAPVPVLPAMPAVRSAAAVTADAAAGSIAACHLELPHPLLTGPGQPSSQGAS
ncbi:MAG TPA: ABC transporter ATP-binding protein [Streptosporangiaceae bacterium]